MQNIRKMNMVWSRNRRALLVSLACATLLVIAQNVAFAQFPRPHDMSHPRIGMASARLEDNLYLIGGAVGRAQDVQAQSFWDPFKGTNLVEAFDLSDMEWDENIAPMQSTRSFACAVAVDDSIYVMGGVDDSGTVLNTVEVYDPSTNTWHYTTSMLDSLKGAAATVVGKYIFVFGGITPDSLLSKKVEAYSIETGKWTYAVSMHYGHAFHSVFNVSGRVYVFGGLSDVFGQKTVAPYPVIEKYYPTLGPISLLISLRDPRLLFGTVERGDSVYVISGLGASGVENGVELLNFHSDSDEAENALTFAAVDTPRVGFVAAFGENGVVYMFGGVSPSYKSEQVPMSSVGVLPGLVPTTSIVNQSNSKAEGFSLAQNYPNPFNPTTTIEFDIPTDAGSVSLDVFNLLGQRVSVLAEGIITPGRHVVSFNGANISSGTYIYRMKTENGIIYRKMVLIK